MRILGTFQSTFRGWRRSWQLHTCNFTCDIIDQDCNFGVADVGGHDTSELLLPGGVPQLQLVLVRTAAAHFGREVHADGGLSNNTCT